MFSPALVLSEIKGRIRTLLSGAGTQINKLLEDYRRAASPLFSRTYETRGYSDECRRSEEEEQAPKVFASWGRDCPCDRCGTVQVKWILRAGRWGLFHAPKVRHAR